MSAPVVVAFVGGTLAIGLSVIGVSQNLIQRHEVQGAADSAALAAADALLGYIEAEPCEIAMKLLAVNNKTLSSCEISELAATVIVEYGILSKTVTARAGVSF